MLNSPLALHLSLLLPLSLSHSCTPLSSGIRTTGNSVRSFTRCDSLFTYPVLTRRDVLVGWSESRWAETPDSHLRHSPLHPHLSSCPVNTLAPPARELLLSHWIMHLSDLTAAWLLLNSVPFSTLTQMFLLTFLGRNEDRHKWDNWWQNI